MEPMTVKARRRKLGAILALATALAGCHSYRS
jgi:hypothetical protein